MRFIKTLRLTACTDNKEAARDIRNCRHKLDKDRDTWKACKGLIYVPHMYTTPICSICHSF